MTPKQAAVLEYLEEHGPSTAREVSEALGVAPSSADYTLRGMFANRLVARQPSFDLRGPRQITRWQSTRVREAI